MSKTKSIVNGFEFADYEEAMQAAKETEGVKFIRGKTNMENPYMVLQIYNKVISENLFETAVGYSFLKEMQEFLYDSPVIADEDIVPIPVRHLMASSPVSVEKSDSAGSRQVNSSEKITAVKSGDEERMQQKKIQEAAQNVTQKTRVRDRIVHIDYKRRFFTASVISAVLAVCVLAMFLITATGRSVTIFNYENQLIDKYEAWEQELEQREAAVKERERQLGQD